MAATWIESIVLFFCRMKVFNSMPSKHEIGLASPFCLISNQQQISFIRHCKMVVSTKFEVQKWKQTNKTKQNKTKNGHIPKFQFCIFAKKYFFPPNNYECVKIRPNLTISAIFSPQNFLFPLCPQNFDAGVTNSCLHHGLQSFESTCKCVSTKDYTHNL